jgi:hypothetical protein
MSLAQLDAVKPDETTADEAVDVEAREIPARVRLAAFPAFR